MTRIDTYANYIRQAAARDSAKWQTIGTYVWPNAWIATSWQGEIDSMKLWLTNRMNWIDANMFPATQPCNSPVSSTLVIDEINFHSDVTTDAGDWIELYNYGAAPIDLSNYMILDGDQYEKYCVIPNGTTLAAGARLVLYADSLLFATRFPAVTNKVGPLCFKLSNLGQKIVIRNAENRPVYSVDYSDTWQCSTDGNGRTLQLTNSTANPNLPTSWYAGCMGGSPGVAYTTCAENPIYSEINYASSATADAGDWVELYNKNASPLNLAGWVLRDGSDVNSYTIPATYSLPAQGYVVFYKDAAKFSSRFPALSNKLGPVAFSLGSTSDVIRLYDNAGTLRYSVCYSSAAPWPADANGLGKTLENGQYNGNHNDAATWFAGCPEGSPGRAYVPGCWPAAVNTVDGEHEAITLYPNPAGEYIQYASTAEVKHIQLLDATGKLVREPQPQNKRIELSGLSRGIYFAVFTLGHAQNYFVRFTKE